MTPRYARPARQVAGTPLETVLAALDAPPRRRRRRRVSRTLVVEMPGRRLRIGHEAYDPSAVVTLAEASRA